MPYTVPVHRDDVFPYGKEIGMGYYDIAENTELLEYLKEKYKQGKVDILLHGYSHEYQLSENKWLAEMKWKSSSQLKEEIPKGKKHDKKTYTGPCGRSADRSGRSCRRGCLRDQ